MNFWRPPLAILLFAVTANANISTLNQSEMNSMRGVSMHSGCPVDFDMLRVVEVKYLDFFNKTKIGKIVVHMDNANSVEQIFKELYAISYPIYQIRPIEAYGGSDFRSIENDNTSAFNCRKATGENSYSAHAYGKAIDINPIENPYIFSSGHIAHKRSSPYVNRDIINQTTANEKAMLLPASKAVEIFKSYGWKWGGDWEGVKDYQHFYVEF